MRHLTSDFNELRAYQESLIHKYCFDSLIPIHLYENTLTSSITSTRCTFCSKKMTGQVKSEPTKKLDAANVTALGYQAAGRGVNDLKGRPGILVSGQGHALKQVQDPPQGPREVQFYQKISSSDDPECLKWRELAPTFYGIESMEGADGKSSQYMVLGRY